MDLEEAGFLSLPLLFSLSSFPLDLPALPFTDLSSLSLSLIVMLWLYFERSLRCKALRATAVNRTGARLMEWCETRAVKLGMVSLRFRPRDMQNP